MSESASPRDSHVAGGSQAPGPERVLGVDLASGRWEDVGSALIEFDRAQSKFTKVDVPAIPWPSAPLTAQELAKAIDSYTRDHGVSAVAIDGPQGWRSPETPPHLPGVGRRCEYHCGTPGKTGPPGTVYPSNQLGWIGFSIEVFRHLLSFRGVRLADRRQERREGAYVVLECFPTSAWRSSGLAPLPGKGKKPDLDPYKSALASMYDLPAFTVSSHDDLQAVVAALCAAGAVGGPVEARPVGEAAVVKDSVRFEGLIWNVAPLAGGTVRAPVSRSEPGIRLHGPASGIAIRVTPGVVAQVNRAGAHQMQIALRGFPGGTKAERRKVRFRIEDHHYALVVGDSHAAWRSHQKEETLDSFEELFAFAADTPGAWLPVSLSEGDESAS